MSPEVAALLGSGISGLVAGGIGLLGGFFWGRATSDRQHAAKRAEAWRQVASSKPSGPSLPEPPPEPPPGKKYTQKEIEKLIRRAD